jgi:hypothetical protein
MKNLYRYRTYLVAFLLTGFMLAKTACSAENQNPSQNSANPTTFTIAEELGGNGGADIALTAGISGAAGSNTGTSGSTNAGTSGSTNAGTSGSTNAGTSGSTNAGTSGWKLNPSANVDASTTIDEESCGEATIEPVIEFIPGNLMIIFDRSVSMNDIFEDTSRLNAAYYAILNGLQPFVCTPNEPDCEEKLNIASILLPSAPGGVGACYVEEITSAQQINWMSATQFADAWQVYWHTEPGNTINLVYPEPDPFVLVLGTPITPAFERAAQAIESANLPGKTAVLFITDGLGTCNQGTPAEVQSANWYAKGITTYVVSVASAGILIPGDGQAFNDAVASAGGTDLSINPADVASLESELQNIIQSASAAPSCEVTLQGGKLKDLDAACERGTVTVNNEPITCDQQNKVEGFWVKGPDRIELVGSACEKLQTQGQLSASFPCEFIIIE